MENDFYYGDKYYYENRIEEGITFKLFIFDFKQDIKEQLDFVLNHSINGLSINKTTEDNLKSILDFVLINNITLKVLNLSNLTLSNLDFLYQFTSLEKLVLIVEAQCTFDFSKLKNLTSLELFYNKFLHSFFTLENLQSLTLHKLKIKHSSEFQLLKKLRVLNISQSSLTEITEFSNLKELKTIELRYFPKLDKIEPLTNCSQIENLYFQNCKKITDWNCIEKVLNLKSITFENCGLIPSVKWLKKLPLKNFRLIGDTNVLDGNLKWLLQIKDIQYLNFPVNKHYNLKTEELWEYQKENKQRF
jgi:hypothetical protein